MIQANEVRVGNYVEFIDSSEIVRIEELYKVHPHPDYFIEWTLMKGAEDSNDNSDSLLSVFQPILLTTEVLEKYCEFAVSSDVAATYETYQNRRTYTNGYFSLVYLYNGEEPDKFLFEYRNGNYDITLIVLSLHQLQNLYFDLTVKELAVNLQV
jgi:hypothetical protein